VLPHLQYRPKNHPMHSIATPLCIPYERVLSRLDVRYAMHRVSQSARWSKALRTYCRTDDLLSQEGQFPTVTARCQ
jgi:hypothetical protein